MGGKRGVGKVGAGWGWWRTCARGGGGGVVVGWGGWGYVAWDFCPWVARRCLAERWGGGTSGLVAMVVGTGRPRGSGQVCGCDEVVNAKRPKFGMLVKNEAGIKFIDDLR